MKPTSHVWEKFGPAKSIGDPGYNRRSSGTRGGWSRAISSGRVTMRRFKCKTCGGIIERIRVPPDYKPSPTIKVEEDGQSFNCEQYLVYHIMVA